MDGLTWVGLIFVAGFAMYGWLKFTAPLAAWLEQWARRKVALRLTHGDRAKADELMREADALDKKEP